MARETRTFLAADIVGSTQRWAADESAMSAALSEFDTAVSRAVADGGGDLFKHTGDGFFAAFADPIAATSTAIAIQRAIDLPTRMAVATGTAELRANDWFGTILSRTARLMDAGSGGQVLVGEATANLVQATLPEGTGLRSLGVHRFRDLHEPYEVFQLLHPNLAVDFPPIRSLESFPNNLPVQMTSFIGRDHEIDTLARMLEEARLVTLTGVGGVGKTRLSLAAAASILDRFPGGAWLVELAALAEPGLIGTETMSAMGASPDGRDPVDIVIGRCHEPTLIVLDNCEHLIDDVAKFTENVLRGAPEASVLATSREALGVMGEAVYRVPSLRGEGGLEDAVDLFASRARLVDRDFAVTNSNRAAVEQICRRLDGIPLAIELATARLRVLDPAGIAERLDDRFRLLTGGSRTALERHRTLAATMDWSYDLLSDKEQALLRRLAVFAGGFDLSATELVCTGEGIEDFEVLDILDRLVAASLVTPDADRRFRMLETVRQYAAEKLLASGEVSVWRDRHANHFEGIATTVTEALLGPTADALMERLIADHDNFRLAMTYSLEIGYPDRAGWIADGLFRFWQSLDNWSEAYEWARRVVDEVTDGTLRGYLAFDLAVCSDNLARSAEGERWHALAMELVPEPTGSPVRRARWHVSIGNRLFYDETQGEAYRAFLAAAAIARASVPDYRVPIWMAVRVGSGLEDPAGYGAVVAELEAVTEVSDQAEHLVMAWSLVTLGRARLGDADGAAAAHREHGRYLPEGRQSVTATQFHAVEVWAALGAGARDRAREAMAQLRRSVEASPVWRFAVDDLEVRLALADGDVRTALRLARRTIMEQRPAGRLVGPAMAALALAAAGDAESAGGILAGVEAERLALGIRPNPWDHEAIEREFARLTEAGFADDPWPMDPEHREQTLGRLRLAIDRALDDA